MNYKLQPQVKSITVYIREEEFDAFLGGEYDVHWTLTPGESYNRWSSYNQVQVQISKDDYQLLKDMKKVVAEKTKDIPF